MPSKRKFLSSDSNAHSPTITPPAPQKAGKLKSILKKPSRPLQLPTSTPSAQIKSEFHAATRDSHPSAVTVREDFRGSRAAPASVKKPKLEIKSEPNALQPTIPEYISPVNTMPDFIDNSAAELLRPLVKKPCSPKYEDDGDTEDLITDSQLQISHSDDAHLMSGGLGPGESPYKRANNSTGGKSSERKGMKKRKVKALDVLSVPPTRTQSSRDQKQVQHEQEVAPPFDPLQIRNRNTALVKVEVAEEKASPVVPKVEPTSTYQYAADGTGAESSAGLTPSGLVGTSAIPMPEPETAINCVDVKVHAASVATSTGRSQAAERRRHRSGQPRSLADVSKILQEYDAARESEMVSIRRALRSAEARAAQLEAQFGMLHDEIASQSKERHTQYSWQLNKFAIFSRRSYRLQDEEEMHVVAGCDDLDEANNIARDMFQSEMNKLESVVEDLGRARSFIEMESGMPQVQMRSTFCGMTKCRSYYADSQWDLTVERVAAN